MASVLAISGARELHNRRLSSAAPFCYLLAQVHSPDADPNKNPALWALAGTVPTLHVLCSFVWWELTAPSDMLELTVE